ncbi:M20 family metallopeptidase [Patescibacteria group bacterium]|nr:M20 family metallopeptidase [Patescibacteria group bacterium]MCG2687504.1 M20 family metallopeptidase [Candidatus Parcubacteria bacterium]
MENSLKDEIIELTRALVRIPSQSGVESEQVIAQYVYHKLQEFGFNPELLGPQEQPSVICFIEKDPNAKTVWLTAPLDTAKIINFGEWSYPPFEGNIDDGKLYGCGVSACKIAIAMYCVLARELARDENFKGNIFLAFNADEQCGSLMGTREIISRAPKADVCLLGYQDIDEISIGSRGWLRLHLQTIGKSVHTGSRENVGVNAIHSMARVINALTSIRLKAKKNTFFWFGPSLNVTTVRGGTAMNMVPDYCRINIDVRLIPGQSDVEILSQIRKELDVIKKRDDNFDYQLDIVQYQGAYITDPTNQFLNILQENIQKELGSRLPLIASGYGSSGNLISELGIPIINAFGVRSGNEHSKDEWIDVESIKPVFAILRNSIIQFTNARS